MNDTVVSTLAANGFGMGLLVVLWRYSTARFEKYQDELKELNQKVLEAFMSQTEATSDISIAVNNNTKAVDNLSDKIYQVLTSDHKKTQEKK